MPEFSFLIFDLDGTLIDSKADIVTSVNLMLNEFGFAALPDALIQSLVGKGIENLIGGALHAANPHHAVDLSSAIARYRALYDVHCLDSTRLYPNVLSTLDRLRAIPKAILSNKSSKFTRKQLHAFGIDHYFVEVMSGDSFAQMKPSPEPILHVLKKYSLDAQRVLMIGDYVVDIEAGKAAGVKTCAALYGFRPKEEVMEYGADFMIESIEELIEIVAGEAER